jgi:hypothetical protein
MRNRVPRGVDTDRLATDEGNAAGEPPMALLSSRTTCRIWSVVLPQSVILATKLIRRMNTGATAREVPR